MIHEKLIVVVEDNEDDWFLLKRAIKQTQFPGIIRRVCDGLEAIDYLQGAGAFNDRISHPLPALLLLDLKLPQKNGFEVITWVRNQSILRRLVIIVFTSSKVESDIVKAYNLGANAFLVKPAAAAKLPDVLKGLETFWLKLNEFAL